MNAGFILEVCALKHDSLLIQVCFYVPPAPPAFMFDRVLSKCYSIQFHCTYKSIDSPSTTCQMLNGVESIKSVRRRRRRWFFNLHSLQITAGCLPVGISSQAWSLWSDTQDFKSIQQTRTWNDKVYKIKSSIEMKAKNKTKPDGT